MKIYKYLGIAIVLMLVVVACKKLPDGFISDGLGYEESPINIPRGRTKTSTALNVDGSSQPTTVRVVHFYDKATGAIVDDLLDRKSVV